MKRRINITLDEDVIAKVDRFASANYTTRSGAITMLIVSAKGEKEREHKGEQ
jgi:metal-responsive CopG/Arc/MetJ family transcriptional regulator